MDYRIGLLAILFYFGCSSPPPPATNAIPQIDGFSSSQLDSIASLLNIFPDGTQFALAQIDDSSVVRVGFKREENVLTTIQNEDSVFEIGSMSKVFTAHLLCQLVLDGTLALDDPISDHLQFELNTDTVITLKQLANHTSGLPRIPPDMMWSALFNRSNPYEEYDVERLKTYLSEKMTVESEPGFGYKYSNLGYGILAYILTRKTASSYEQLLQTRICTPLNMDRTTTLRSTINQQLVSGLDPSGERAENWDLAALEGAGAILSSTEDLSKYVLEVLNHPDSSIRLQMQRSHRLDPRRSVALGWHILDRVERDRLYWHNGGTGGYRSCMVLNPRADRAVILLTNMSSGHPKAKQIDELCFELMEQLSRE